VNAPSSITVWMLSEMAQDRVMEGRLRGKSPSPEKLDTVRWV